MTDRNIPSNQKSATAGPYEAKRIDRNHWVIQSERGVIAKTCIPIGATEEEIEANALLLAGAANSASSPVETTMPHLLDQFTEALKADPDLAWSWHCNLAMPIMDRVKCSHTAANEAAADLLRHLFHIDIRSNSCWAITVQPEEPSGVRIAPEKPIIDGHPIGCMCHYCHYYRKHPQCKPEKACTPPCGNPVMINAERYRGCRLPSGHEGECSAQNGDGI
jgi:hypothetical protein